mgnify:CR=1 FL=1
MRNRIKLNAKLNEIQLKFSESTNSLGFKIFPFTPFVSSFLDLICKFFLSQMNDSSSHTSGEESTINKICQIENMIVHQLLPQTITITQQLAEHKTDELKGSLNEFYGLLEEIHSKLSKIINCDLPLSGIPHFPKQVLLRQIELLDSLTSLEENE